MTLFFKQITSIQLFYTFIFCCCFQTIFAQITPLAGPVAGHYTDSTALFWLAYSPKHKVSIEDIKPIILEKHSKWLGSVLSMQIDSIAEYSKGHFYHISCKREIPVQDSIERDITFLAGSCAFQYPVITGQRQKRNKIFETMSNTPAEFMIWLGDNIYYLFGQWNSLNSMVVKNIVTRNRKYIAQFIQTMPNYALWDDHDFGPNDSDANFENKHLTTQMFKHTWMNPYYGIDGEGVCTHFSKGDADFFFLDTRSFSDMKKGIMLGEKQLNWLKNLLLESKANFKFIAVGAQIISDDNMGVHMGKFAEERQVLLDFIAEHNITGIVFMSGDRHFAEVMQMKREGKYTLQEITTSPLTSFIDERGSINSFRKEGTFITDTNFARFNIRGQGNDRECFVELFDRLGGIWWTHTIKLIDLQ